MLTPACNAYADGVRSGRIALRAAEVWASSAFGDITQPVRSVNVYAIRTNAFNMTPIVISW